MKKSNWYSFGRKQAQRSPSPSEEKMEPELLKMSGQQRMVSDTGQATSSL